MPVLRQVKSLKNYRTIVYYNFSKIHKSLRVTPAMQAGLTKRVWTLEDIVNLTNQFQEKKNSS